MRKVNGGVFSNWINEHLKPGDTIHVMAPQGRFFVPIEPRGAAPLRGHRRRQRHHADPVDHEDRARRASRSSRFTLIYGNRALKSTMFKEEIEDLKNKYLTRLVLHHVFSDEHTDAPINSGVMNRDKIGEFLGALVPARNDRPCLRLRPVPDERRGRGGAAGRRRARGAHPHRALRHRAAGRAGGGRGDPPGAARRRRAAPRSRSSATACAARSSSARTSRASSTARRPPAWRCRSRAPRACAAPAAPS